MRSSIGTRAHRARVQIESAPASTVRHVTTSERKRCGAGLPGVPSAQRRSGLDSLDPKALPSFASVTEPKEREDTTIEEDKSPNDPFPNRIKNETTLGLCPWRRPLGQALQGGG